MTSVVVRDGEAPGAGGQIASRTLASGGAARPGQAMTVRNSYIIATAEPRCW
jgi:hypothetical protein